MKFLLMLLFLAQPLMAQTFTVTHEKKLWRDGRGKIEVTNDGISYSTEKKEDSRQWKYEDIQYFDRISQKEFILLSYEDSRMLFGRDKAYHFKITDGELSDDLFLEISEKMNRPVTNRQLPDNVIMHYQIPVKHTHTFGGCEGVLQFAEESIHYNTNHKKDARAWKLGRDIQSIWSMDRYQLEIHVYENNRREFSRTRIYNFVLKEPLDPDVYMKMKLKLYDLEITYSLIP